MLTSANSSPDQYLSHDIPKFGVRYDLDSGNFIIRLTENDRQTTHQCDFQSVMNAKKYGSPILIDGSPYRMNKNSFDVFIQSILISRLDRGSDTLNQPLGSVDFHRQQYTGHEKASLPDPRPSKYIQPAKIKYNMDKNIFVILSTVNGEQKEYNFSMKTIIDACSNQRPIDIGYGYFVDKIAFLIFEQAFRNAKRETDVMSSVFDFEGG